MSKKQFIVSTIIALLVCSSSFLFDFFVWKEKINYIIIFHILSLIGYFFIIFIVHTYKQNNKNTQFKSLKFNGTIIIGDPCEMVINDKDFEKTNYGVNMFQLGFNDYLSFEFEEDAPTIINAETNEIIGSFCTDSSMVAIVYLDDLLKYNPSFNQHIEYKENWMVIKDFDGIISIRNDRDYKKIIGKGNVNFCSEQKIDIEDLFEENKINVNAKKEIKSTLKYYQEKDYVVFDKLIEFLEIFNDTKIKTPVRYLNNEKYFNEETPYKDYVESVNNFASKYAIDGIYKEVVEKYEEVVGEKLAPVGENGFHYTYFISESGKIYAGYDSSFFYLGNDYYQFFENLCDGPRLKEIKIKDWNN